MALDAEQARLFRDLLADEEVAALGTLHAGEPFVSMTPFAALPDGRGFVLHVSRLAAHTQHMAAEPKVSLMVTAPAAADVAPQARPRISIQGDAAPCPPGDPRHDAARAAYLARFPRSEPMFGFGDFSLVVVIPRTARLVGGFGMARSVGADTLAELARTVIQGTEAAS